MGGPGQSAERLLWVALPEQFIEQFYRAAVVNIVAPISKLSRMMSSAHSKDNGSPTSVAHNLDGDQTESVVVRRDDLVVIDNAALGSLCEDVQIASRRNAGVLEVEWPERRRADALPDVREPGGGGGAARRNLDRPGV